jgi:geranylgeranyl reductase family protein
MITVIGAGPAGAQAAYALAKAGHKVELFEEHAAIGVPVACTGLLTKTIHGLLSKDELESVLVNQLDAVDVVAPGGHTVRIKTHEYVVDRAAFDRMLVRKAIDAGVVLRTSHIFTGKKGSTVFLSHKGKTVEREIDFLVGADGPTSPVAKSTGIYGNREFYVGLQATMRGGFDKKVFTTWFGDAAPDFFAWSVPETDSLSRVGVASQTNTRALFESLTKRVGGMMVARQAGPIPIFKPGLVASSPKQGVFLVGDAAALVKATTGGGIITGMQSADILADCITREKDYEKSLAPLRRELWLHLLIRKTLNGFGQKDYDKLVALMDDRRVQDLLAENPREYPSRFIIRLLATKPGLLRFAPKGISALIR